MLLELKDAPLAPELAYIKKWTEEYGFSLDLIIEACNRTMAKLHQPSFEYTDSILKKWIASNVHHLSDLKRLDSALPSDCCPPKSRNKTCCEKQI